MLWMFIATLCSGFVKGLCGFGDTLTFTTILSFSRNNIDISPVELVMAYPTNVIMIWKERRGLDWKVCLPVAALILLGDIPGIFLLKNMDSSQIKVIFGVIIIGMAIEMLLRERAKGKGRQSRVALAIIGVLSGILCGLYGVGALLAAYMDRVTEDTRAFKANICFVFMVESTFRVIAYIWTGILTAAAFKEGLLMLPVILIGLAAGIKSSSFLDEKLVSKIVLVILMLSGVALVINNL